MRISGLATAAALCVAVSAIGYASARPDMAQGAFWPGMDFGKPYLAPSSEDPLTLSPPAPAEGSTRLARDLEANRGALKGQGGARWNLAARDADLRAGAVGRTFSCTAGIAISEAGTPAIARLLKRANSDFAASTSKVKDYYQRNRPFMDNGQPTCTPADEAGLRKNWSYPSGHSAIGYGAGMVLATLFPEKATALVARGRAFGDSRYLCNVHWLSDVEEGRGYATAAFARLVANAEFQRDLQAARAEVQAMKGKLPAPEGCAEEAAALSVR